MAFEKKDTLRLVVNALVAGWKGAYASDWDKCTDRQKDEAEEVFKKIRDAVDSYEDPCKIKRAPGNASEQAIADECENLKQMLLEKNRNYGDSALNPVRIFSKVDSIEQINVRLDDKISRLARGSAGGEDVELDLMGYLILKRVAKRMREESNQDWVAVLK